MAGRVAGNGRRDRRAWRRRGAALWFSCAAAFGGPPPAGAQAKSAAPPGGEPAAAAEKLTVLNLQGYFSDQALQDFFREKLAEETRAHLAKGTDGLWVWTSSTSLGVGSNYCWVGLGLTEAPPKGRAARIPDTVFASAVTTDARGKLNDDQLRGCMSDALKAATEKFVKAGLPAQLDGIEKTRSKGTRKTEPPSPSSVQLYWFGLSPSGKERVFAEIPSEFRAAFDYRRLQWAVLAYSFRFDDKVFCSAIAGVAARAPSDQNARTPTQVSTHFWEMTPQESKAKDAESRCRDEAAVNATKRAVGWSWDDKELLSGFARTREDGVPLVANYRRKPPPPPPDPTRFRQSLKVGSDTHCGLVIQVRPPIAQVQAMIGETWLKIAQLHPPGEKPCRFLNRVYQDPE